MSEFLTLLRSLSRGESVARAMMHLSIERVEIEGDVVDVGGGRGASYLAHLARSEGTKVSGFDLKESPGVTGNVDFEKDPLPRPTGSADGVLMFNILEHIYNHRFLAGETFRVLRSGGKLVGFVPFLVNYHPDPHDYFRYTEEALRRILEEVGYREVEVTPVGKGPFFVNLNNLAPSLPAVLASALLVPYYLLDRALLALRPKIGRRYPLGYLFTAKKP